MNGNKTVTANFSLLPPTPTPRPTPTPEASVSLDRTSAYPGDVITIFGTALPSYVSVGSITIGGIEARPNPSPSTDVNGNFSSTIMVPGINAGNHEVSVTTRSWPDWEVLSTTKTVLTVHAGSYNLSGNNASVPVSPTNASVGANVVLTGKFFPGYQIVNTLTVGGIDAKPTPPPTTDANGFFQVTIMLPLLSSGSFEVSAVVGDTRRYTMVTIK